MRSEKDIMTVRAVLAARIKDFEDAAENLYNCVTVLSELSEASEEEKDQLRSKYGIREDVLFNAALLNAARLLEATANNFREDINKCEVDYNCW